MRYNADEINKLPLWNNIPISVYRESCSTYLHTSSCPKLFLNTGDNRDRTRLKAVT